MREERETVGALIRRARQDRGLTQRQLAERLHVTDKSVSKWERDVCRPDGPWPRLWAWAFCSW